MRSNSNKSKVTIETTFGKITVFKEGQEIKRTPFKQAEEFVIDQKTTGETKAQDEKNFDANFGHENFYGIEEDRPKPDVIKENDNFFDQEFFGDYEKAILNTTPDLQITDNSKNLDDLNFIDSHYFSKDTSDSAAEILPGSDLKVISKDDIKDDQYLNFIDMLVFQQQQDINDPIIGSIQNLKKTKMSSQANNQKESVSKSSEIPLIQTQNLVEDDTRKPKKEQEASGTKPKPLSNHKMIASEVPSNWDYVTIDEAAKILKNNICYFNEEQGLLAIDKPYGLPSIAGPKVHLCVSRLLPALEKLLKIDYRLLMAHRLDQYTTGVMLFATNTSVAKQLNDMFREKKVLKQYLAITKFVPQENSGEINIPLFRRQINNITKTYLSPNYDENTKFVLDKPRRENDDRKKAITKYRILDSRDKAALLEIQPLTGYQHQIRAHLSFGLGCPILGDHKYSHNIENLPQKLPVEMLKNLKISQSKVRHVPLHLHSYRILLPEFHKSTNIFITAKLPLHFVNNLKRLKLKF